MEPLSIASGAAGIVQLGISVSEGVLTYYRSWRDAEGDVRKMYDSMEALTKTLRLLKRAIESKFFDQDIKYEVEESIEASHGCIETLRKKLDKVKLTPALDGWREKAKVQIRRSLYPFKESTLVKLRELAFEIIDDLRLALNVLQIDASASMLRSLEVIGQDLRTVSLNVEDLQEQSTATGAAVNDLTEVTASAYLQKIHDWLSPLRGEFERKQVDTFSLSGRQDGTGRRLLESKQYTEWLDGTDKVLWGFGMQGAGKTVMTSFVINSLEKDYKNQNVGLAFLYCDYKEAKKQSLDNLLASLVHQLVTRKIILVEEISSIYRHHVNRKTRPSRNELLTLLQDAVKCYSQTFIIVDALDECSEIDDARGNLLLELQALEPQVSLMVTSRDIPSLHQHLENATRVEIRASDEDVRTYVRQRIAGNTRLKGFVAKNSDLETNIEESVANNARGMFLQARLHLDALASKTTLRKVKDTLKTLPETLYDTYDGVMSRIRAQSPDDASLAMKVLYWIHYAFRPLEMLEIQHALAIEPGDKNLDEDSIPDESLVVSVCAGMVTLQQESHVIGLIHHTAQEYLERRRLDFFPGAQEELLQSCLTYLSFDEFSVGPCSEEGAMEARLKRFPLYLYTSQFWANHAGEILEDLDITGKSREELEGAKKISGEVIGSTLDFLDQSSSLSSSIQVVYGRAYGLIDYTHFIPRRISALWVASHFGLKDVVQILVDKGANLNERSDWEETALQPAALKGFAMTAKVLLDHGADMELGDHAGNTPLHRATLLGHEAMSSLLLDYGANIHALNKQGGTPLHRAAFSGRTMIAEMLIERGADIVCKDAGHDTPLHIAVRFGQEQMTRLLLEKGAGSTLVDNDEAAQLLYLAAHRGPKAIVELILTYRARHSTLMWPPSAYAYALKAAARRHLDQVVELLFDNLHLSSLSEVDEQGKTMLHIFCLSGDLQLVERLIASGADPKLVDKQGRSCLHHAAAADTQGSEELLAVLLKQGMPSDEPDIDGWTPLHWAARSGQDENIRVLLDAGADRLSKSRRNWTPLTVALYHNHEMSAVLLKNSTLSPAWQAADLEEMLTSELSRLISGQRPSAFPATRIPGVRCDGCDMSLFGPRYKCRVCADFDFCYKCFLSAPETHPAHDFDVFDKTTESSPDSDFVVRAPDSMWAEYRGLLDIALEP